MATLRLMSFLVATLAVGFFAPGVSVAGEAAPGALPVTSAPPSGRTPQRNLAKGMFLVASRKLSDPNFSESVVLLLEYDAQGALGLIINRPTRVPLANLLPEVDELQGRADVIYVGGPVARERIVLLMRSSVQPGDSGRVFEDTYVSSSLATLKQLVASRDSGDTFHAYAGYAGWAPGQLDGEVSRGDWHISPGREDLVFDKEAADIWPELIEKNSGLWVRRAGPRLRVATGNH